MTRAASEDIAARMKAFLATHDEINMIFAAAPSQSDTLALLREMPGIDWSRVNAFHMDGTNEAFTTAARAHLEHGTTAPVEMTAEALDSTEKTLQIQQAAVCETAL